MWVAIAVIAIALILAVMYRPKAQKVEVPKSTVPEVLDGRKIRRIYGTVWIDDPIVLAFKQVGTIPIKAKGK